MMFGSYPKVYALGHKAIEDILKGFVVVQEKIDGSQLNFGIDPEKGLVVRSRGREQYPGGDDKMFRAGIEVIKTLPLTEGWCYRAEYLQKPKHNALAYERIPNHHLILYDINPTPGEVYLSHFELQKEAERLGLEVVPLLWAGEGAGLKLEDFRGLFDKPGVLGGPMIEGVVVKNYLRFSVDGKAMMGKYVSERFKEIHKVEWVKPGKGDIVLQLIRALNTEARWEKAIQHLRDSSLLLNAPQDIGPLIRAVKQDVEEEATEFIKEELFRDLGPMVLRGMGSGLPEWYKNKLLESAFEQGTEKTKE